MKRTPYCAHCGCNWSERTEDCATCATRHRQRSTALMLSHLLYDGETVYELVSRDPDVVRAPWDVVTA